MIYQLSAECSGVRRCPCDEQEGKALSGAGEACVVANSIFHPKCPCGEQEGKALNGAGKACVVANSTFPFIKGIKGVKGIKGIKGVQEKTTNYSQKKDLPNPTGLIKLIIL